MKMQFYILCTAILYLSMSVRGATGDDDRSLDLRHCPFDGADKTATKQGCHSINEVNPKVTDYGSFLIMAGADKDKFNKCAASKDGNKLEDKEPKTIEPEKKFSLAELLTKDTKFLVFGKDLQKDALILEGSIQFNVTGAKFGQIKNFEIAKDVPVGAMSEPFKKNYQKIEGTEDDKGRFLIIKATAANVNEVAMPLSMLDVYAVHEIGGLTFIKLVSDAEVIAIFTEKNSTYYVFKFTNKVPDKLVLKAAHFVDTELQAGNLSPEATESLKALSVGKAESVKELTSISNISGLVMVSFLVASLLFIAL